MPVIDKRRNWQNMAGWVLVSLLGSVFALGQATNTSAIDSAKGTPEKPPSARKTVKAESVTINMPEGMTKDQADAILNELKAIHQLLQNQQNTNAQVAPALVPTSDKVQMKLASGEYSMGRDDAPVTVVEFVDYQCPFCRKYHTESFAELKKKYIDTGKVRFISRDFPLDFHPYAQKAAEAARCAGDQNKFWELRDQMITNSADLTQDAILKMAQAVSLDMTTFRACLDADKHKAEIQKDAADASTVGVSATPSFVIGKASKGTLDGDRVVGAVGASVFEAEFQKFAPATP